MAETDDPSATYDREDLEKIMKTQLEMEQGNKSKESEIVELINGNELVDDQYIN